MQWDKNDQMAMKLNATKYENRSLRKTQLRSLRLAKTLQYQNRRLTSKVIRMNVTLANVTTLNSDLKTRLAKVESDLEGLKSNTSRLEGEKEGLEEVLKVKVSSGKDKHEEHLDKKKEDEAGIKEEAIDKLIKKRIDKLGLVNVTQIASEEEDGKKNAIHS